MLADKNPYLPQDQKTHIHIFDTESETKEVEDDAS